MHFDRISFHHTCIYVKIKKIEFLTSFCGKVHGVRRNVTLWKSFCKVRVNAEDMNFWIINRVIEIFKVSFIEKWRIGYSAHTSNLSLVRRHQFQPVKLKFAVFQFPSMLGVHAKRNREWMMDHNYRPLYRNWRTRKIINPLTVDETLPWCCFFRIRRVTRREEKYNDK